MIGLFAELPLVFAQDAGSGSLLSLLLPLAPVPFLYYILVFRPQQQQEKAPRLDRQLKKERQGSHERRDLRNSDLRRHRQRQSCVAGRRRRENNVHQIERGARARGKIDGIHLMSALSPRQQSAAFLDMIDAFVPEAPRSIIR